MKGRKKISIVRRVRHTGARIALLLSVPVIAAMITTLIYSNEYQAMIRRMDRAAELKPSVETVLAENLFSVAAGRTAFEDCGAEELIRGVDDTLDDLLEETEGNGHLQLTVARRTMDTLEQYILRIRSGMRDGTPISEIEGMVDEVRDVGRLVADMVDSFIGEEITNAANASGRLRQVASETRA